ncbi:MAG: hypothetical protein WBD32_22585 [Acidobacteriaceae bacterium]
MKVDPLTWVLVAAISSGSPAQTEMNSNQLLQKAVVRLWTDENQAEQFTYSELWHNQNFDGRGKLIVDESAKFEAVSLGGKSYLQMVERDGKPLSNPDVVAEKRGYDSAIGAGKGLTMGDRLADLTSKEVGFHLDLQLLPAYFNCTILGSEVVREHNAYHLDCLPRKDRKPKGRREAAFTQVHVQVWISEQNYAFARVDEELLKKHDGMLPGTTASLNWTPVDGVWLPQMLAVSGEADLKGKAIRFDTRYSYSDYKRFRTEVRVLDGYGSGPVH